MLLCLILVFSLAGCTPKDTTPPAAPTDLGISTPGNDSTPFFLWHGVTDDSGVDHYEVVVDGGEPRSAAWSGADSLAGCVWDAPLSDGSHTVEVRAVDKAGNCGDCASLTFTCDKIIPIVSSVAVDGITTSSATITWTSDEACTSQVEYGRTTSYGSSSVLDTSLVAGHTVNLAGLSGSTTYHFRVKSTDAASNEATSGDYTFATLQPSTDWINDLIEKFESDPVANPPLSIWRYNYEGQTVYYVPPMCCDMFSRLYDASGNVICHPDGGFTGMGDGRCPDFFAKRTDGTLIWRDARSYP